MKNPYKILGIKEGASQKEIKEAYLKQVKKYHPDKHQNNPLYELAEEKLREINEAYEYLTKNNGQGSYGSSNTNSGYNRPSSEFMEIRRDIDHGNLAKAEMMLNRMSNRDAEWHFLRGMIYLRKGWYDEALTNVQNAVAMDPGNMEYKNALNSIIASGNGYRTSAYGRGYATNDDLCRMLQCYCCADALCDCI